MNELRKDGAAARYVCVRRAAWLAVAMVAAACGRLDPETELATAAERMAAGDYREAAIRISSVIQTEPDNAAARKLRGELELLLGNYAGAAEEFQQARALGAPLDSIVLKLAEARTALGQPDLALALLGSAAETLAGDPTYWTIRAEALLRAGRTAEAQLALDEGDRAGDGGTRARIVRAQVLFARNDPSTAEELLDQALSTAPDDASVLTARADLFAGTGRLDEAVTDLRRAADLYGAASLGAREVAALLGLAQLHLALNDLDAAEETAARLAQQAPQALLTAYFRGLVEYRRGRFDEAAALIQPLVNAAPDTVQFRALLGVIHLARGNLGQAEQQLLTVLATAPRDPAAVKLLAETRLRQQRPEAALEALRALQDTTAEDPQIGLLSGLASLLAGNTEEGLVYLEQATALDPANEFLKLQLARAYVAVGRDADASSLLQGRFEGGGSAPLEAGLLRLFAESRLGEADAGAAAAEELLAEFPREPRALTAVAVHFQLRGESQRARELFEQAAELETDGATARLFIAGALVQEGRNQEAEQLLAQVIEEQPENAQVLMALAELLTARAALDEAAQLLRQATEYSVSVAPRLALAQLRIRQGDLAAAEQELDIAAEAAPDSPQVDAIRGLLALSDGRAADAAMLLRRAESKLPNRLGVTLALARAEFASGQPEVARETLRRLLELAPRSFAGRLTLGGVELALGNAAEALSIANALKVEFPTQGGGYLLEGEAQMAARRYSAAADSLTAAFEREPRWPVLARVVETLQLAGRADEALRMIEDWVVANPQHVPGATTRAVLLQNAGRSEEALRAYDAVLSTTEDDNLTALNNAAWLAHELADPRALGLAERAYELAPDNAAVLDTFGWILLAEGREESALTHLSRAAELAPQFPEISYHLAEALAALGRSNEARTVLTPLLEDERDFQQRTDAQRLLDTL